MIWVSIISRSRGLWSLRLELVLVRLFIDIRFEIRVVYGRGLGLSGTWLIFTFLIFIGGPMFLIFLACDLVIFIRMYVILVWSRCLLG